MVIVKTPTAKLLAQVNVDWSGDALLLASEGATQAVGEGAHTALELRVDATELRALAFAIVRHEAERASMTQRCRADWLDVLDTMDPAGASGVDHYAAVLPDDYPEGD